jgi:hypothetical protein
MRQRLRQEALEDGSDRGPETLAVERGKGFQPDDVASHHEAHDVRSDVRGANLGVGDAEHGREGFVHLLLQQLPDERRGRRL